jgi:hypothetical protein
MSMPLNQIAAMLEQTKQGVLDLTAQAFSYVLTLANVASGATASGALQILADSAFLIQSTVVTSVDVTTGLLVSNPVGTIQLTDSGSGQSLFSAALPLSSVFGTAQLPFLWTLPRLLKANSTIAAQFTAGTTTNNVTYYLSFNGMKIYNLG